MWPKIVAQSASLDSLQSVISLNQEVRAAALKATQQAFPGVDLPRLDVGVPKLEHGDYDVAVFSFVKPLRLKPAEIVDQLKKELQKDEQFLARFDIQTSGGHINFRVRDSVILENVQRIRPEFGRNSTLAGKRVLVEFVSANPTGPLHIGHGRWAVLGDSICRLLEACGAIVTREFYINDAGAQIARFRDSVDAVRKGRLVPEGGYQGEYIADLAKSSDDPVQAMIEHHRRTLESMGVKFDVWFSEKTLHDGGLVDQAVRDLEAAGFTYRAVARPQDEEDEPNPQSGGAGGEAVWFKTTDPRFYALKDERGRVLFALDDKDRVLVRADGRPTYLAADVAYHADKVRRGYDLLINIFGADHHGYVARISAAIQAASDEKQNHEILVGQLVKLTRGGKEARMSKRKGTVVFLHDLMEEIGADAVRIFMGRTSFNQGLTIDLELALKQSKDNPVFYFQYAHARISQLLVQATKRGMTVAAALPSNYELNPEERALLVYLLRFPDLVEAAARRRDVSRVQEYTAKLAALFHRFYYEHRVVDTTNPELSGVRLLFAVKTQQVLKNVLTLLGVSAPDKMERLPEPENPEAV